MLCSDELEQEDKTEEANHYRCRSEWKLSENILGILDRLRKVFFFLNAINQSHQTGSYSKYYLVKHYVYNVFFVNFGNTFYNRMF